MSRSTYRIETFSDHGMGWHRMMTWWGLQKGVAEGAFMVLKAGYGGQRRYRLVQELTGRVVDEWDTGTGPQPA